MSPIPCFVISLKGSPRRAVIAEGMANAGIDFRFHDAVDGRALSEAALAQVYDDAKRSTRRPLSRPEIGCALSHLAVYERILAEGHEAAAVFEDDAIPTGRLTDFLANASQVPRGIDVVSFFSEAGVVHREPAFRVAGIACHRASGNLSHAVGYFIRRGAAKILIDDNPRVSRVADWPIDPRRLHFYLTLPCIVGHGEQVSTLQGGRDWSADNRRHGRRALVYGRNGPHDIGRAVLDWMAKRHRRLQMKLFPHRFLDLATMTPIKPRRK